jgi:hypothetical protein
MTIGDFREILAFYGFFEENRPLQAVEFCVVTL